MTAAYTQNDFIFGRPERLLGAVKKPKILVTWQHGDEELGPRFGYYMVTKRPDLLEHVDYLCGNPVAAAHHRDKGHVESDLNRSYNPAGAPQTHEEQRAQEILALIKRGGYDFVLDLHTSVTEIGQMFIVQHDTAAVRAMIGASQLTRVVVMPPAIGDASLIGQVPFAAVLEFNTNIAHTDKAMHDVELLVDTLIGNKQAQPMNREFYYVDRPVPKTEDPGTDAHNFVLCRDGYYPVLMGEGPHSYRNDPTKTYLGFAATRKEDKLL